MRNNTWNKILALLLGGSMVFGLAACGGDTGTTESPAGGSESPAAETSTGGETSGTEIAADALVVQVAYENNPGEPVSDAAEEWERLAEERSNGTIDIQLFPSSQLGSKTDLIDQMLMGEGVVTICDGSFLAQYGAPEMDIVSAPYVFDNFDQCWKVIESDWWAEQTALMEDNGIHIITTNWIFGERNLMTTSPVESVSDLQGMIIRTPNTASYVRAFELMGAAPTAMAIGDVYTSLQQGTIDGLENTYSTLYGSAYYEVAKYITTTKHVNMFAQWICSQSWWDSLTEEQQTILSETGDEAGLINNDLQTSSTEEYMQLMEDNGVTIIDLTDEQRAEFADASMALYEDPSITGQWRDGLYEMIQEIIAE